MAGISKNKMEARQSFYGQIVKLVGVKPIEGLALDKFIRGLMKDCITHHAYCEFECNGATREKYPTESWADYDKARDFQMNWLEKRMTALEARIKRKAATLGLHVRLEGDPRGPTVRFSKDPIDASEVLRNGVVGADVWNW